MSKKGNRRSHPIPKGKGFPDNSSKILTTINEAVQLCGQLRKRDRSITLAGGVFDLLHYGHLKFLQAAKKKADILIVALEGDTNVRRKKGGNRPLNPANIRAEILAALEVVDYVLILPEMKSGQDYFKLVEKLKPNIIAVTEGDSQLENKRKQAEAVNGKLAIVTTKLPVLSTTHLAKILRVD